MANWYISSVKYTAVTQWAALTLYAIGDLRRQLAAPAVDGERVFRCTTAGTSGAAEPTWVTTAGATTNDATAVWTEVTGNNTYGWTAAAATLALGITRAAAGDTYYVGHDHAETRAAALTLTIKGTKTAPDRFLCVNTAGSTPPVSADLRTTATITTTGAFALGITCLCAYVYGITFSSGSGANSINFSIQPSGGDGEVFFDACGLKVPATTSGSLRIGFGSSSTPSRVILQNTILTFGSAAGRIEVRGGEIIWRNTASAIGGTIPTTLFVASSAQSTLVTCDGLDLSASTGTLVGVHDVWTAFNFVNCKLNASVTVAATPTSSAGNRVYVGGSGSAGNCARNEVYDYRGTQTAETTIVRTSPAGASDGTTPVSWKVVSTANSKANFPFASLPISIWNTTLSSSTATIQIVNDGVTLTNADIWVEVEYLGSGSTPIASVVSAGLADVLATGTNLTTSTDTWTTTGLGSPVKQKISVTFTPGMTGPVRLVVKLARASTTVYVDPLITIT